jgi:hypothetical protein
LRGVIERMESYSSRCDDDEDDDERCALPLELQSPRSSLHAQLIGTREACAQR